MLPYGIIINQDRFSLQQAIMLWQRKFGIFKTKNILLFCIFPALLFSIIYAFAILLLDKENSFTAIIIATVIYFVFLGIYIALTAIRSAKEFSASSKNIRMQLVLKQEALEITTEYSREVIPYDEIAFCFEKNFLLTLIYDKNSLPVAVAKMLIEKGDYETFVALLKSKIADRYEKKGES